MKFGKALIVGIILPILLYGCASSGWQSQESPARILSRSNPLAPMKRQPVTDADPALWLLSDADTNIYLFGTVHYLPPRLGWFDEAVRDAFDSADTLVLELIAPPPEELYALMMDMALARDGIALRDRLDEQSRAQYEKVMQKLGQKRSAYDSYEPWFAFLMIYQQLVEKAGIESDEGAEEALSITAKRDGKVQIGLETAKEQLAIFDSLPPEDGIELLKSVISDPEGVQKQVKQIVDYWSAGDVDGLDRFLTETAEDTETEQALIARRNANWADWIAKRMDEPGTVFLAVGAAHLAGPGNVRKLLEQRNFVIRRLDY